MDNGLGSEEGSYRPILIISSDRGNETCPTIVGAYLTTKPKYGKINVPLYIDGKQEYFMGNQLVTADKRRLERYAGSVTEDELYEIDEALRTALDLYYYDDEEEIEDEEEESENLEEKIADLELELKIVQAAYDRLLAKVVEMRVDADIASAKPEPKKEDPPKVEPPKIEPPKVVAPAVVAKPEPKVDVNTATETALKKIGWDSESAKAILANRPYDTLEELKSLPGITKTLFNLVSPRMDCVRVVKEEKPVLTEKVNINTWSVDQITEALGCAKTNAGQIVAYRVKNGLFRDVNELYNVTGISRLFVSRYIDCFTVGEPVTERTEVVEGKVYVNTMNGPQMAEILGCSRTYGAYIVTYRNKNGLYRSKDELFNVPQISRGFIEKHWEKFEL
jgi:DNA uptake protein ComE-like DNA-binding protein/mRNA-degrading endonuclease toxin of MazEF toxin-antitoxin module